MQEKKTNGGRVAQEKMGRDGLKRWATFRSIFIKRKLFYFELNELTHQSHCDLNLINFGFSDMFTLWECWTERGIKKTKEERNASDAHMVFASFSAGILF